MELKSPFALSKLHSSQHQLFGQSEVIAQKNGLNPVLGCLTNFWTINVSLRLPGSSTEMYDRIFFKTAGVLDLRPYTIRLLLLFCDLTIEELTELTQDSTIVGVRVRDFAEETQSYDNKPSLVDRTDPRDSPKTVDRKRTKKGDSADLKRNHFSLDDDSDEENENRWEELRKVHEWDARRHGFTYLCKKNLDALQHELNGRHSSL